MSVELLGKAGLRREISVRFLGIPHRKADDASAYRVVKIGGTGHDYKIIVRKLPSVCRHMVVLAEP